MGTVITELDGVMFQHFHVECGGKCYSDEGTATHDQRFAAPCLADVRLLVTEPVQCTAVRTLGMLTVLCVHRCESETNGRMT